MAGPAEQPSPWAAPRRRAQALRERHTFAAEVLTLYLALLEVWEQAWAAAREDSPAELAGWAARRVLPRVAAVTAQSGPPPLVERLPPDPAGDPGAAEQLLAAWLAGDGTGDELVPVERFLARASLRGPLAAVGAGAAFARDTAPPGGRRCPQCAGPPQLSFRTDTGDRLVSGGRRLLCARCGESWAFSGSACAGCGESGGARRTVYTEQRDGPQVGRGDDGSTTFPHLRVEACGSCQRYLIDVDLGRDPAAVPEVDELAALPLDLYAVDCGLSKITPNLMGF